MSDLVERLRAFASQWVKGALCGDTICQFTDRTGTHIINASDLTKAIAHIETLQAELAEARAKVERAREALGRIAEGRTIRFTGSEHHGKPLRDKDAQQIARAALKEIEP